MAKPVDLSKQIKNLLWAGAALGTGSAAAAAGVHGVAKLYNQLMEEHRYNKMIDRFPELAKHRQSREIFSTLNRAAPDLAADPLVAATFVRQTLATDLGGGPAVDPMMIAKLKAHVGSSREHVLRTVSQGLTSMVEPVP